MAKVVEISAHAREAWENLLRLFFANRDRFLAVSARHGLTPAHTKALLDLDPDQPAPMRQLADRLACDPSYVTALIDRLEENGYVARRASAADRRVKEVVLTEAGRNVRDEVSDALHRPPRALTRLSAADQRALRDITRKLVDEGRS